MAWIRIALWLCCLIPAAGAPALAAGSPVPVARVLSLESGDWYPLPASDMKAASADAALEEITRGGWLRIVDPESESRSGTLALALSLIGPAETAKLTITLRLDDRPTAVSTASISVRGLDRQGFYRAFEHIGRSAAERMNAKLEALGLDRGAGAPAAPHPFQPDDPELAAAFDDAQRLKHARQYQRARVRFEQVAEASGRGSSRLVEMARDELAYGLPLFEARQVVLDLGRLVNGGRAQFEPAIARAEQLYRQIQAENPGDVARVQEAQRALDELAVSRRAIDNVLRQSAMARLSSLRIALMERWYAEGRCPDEQGLRPLLEFGPRDVTLDSVDPLDGGGQRYAFLDQRSGERVRMTCGDGEVRIEGH